MPAVLPSDFLRLKAIYSESSERWQQGFHYDMCKDCREDPPTIIEDFQTGDIICGSCGLVLESNLVDTRPEWRTFANDDSSSRVDPNRVGDGPDESLIGDQLSTSISFTGGSDSTNQALQRAQNKVVKDGQDGKINQNLKAAFATLSAYISGAHLSKVVNDTATKIMKVCMIEKCIKTTPSCAECAVIIYKASKAAGEAREIKECMRIACLDQLKRKAFNAAYKRIDQVLREASMKAENKQTQLAEATSGKEGEVMKNMIAQTSDMPRAVMSARQILPRFCEHARLKAWQRSLTEAFADAVEDTQALDSRGPSNVAATSLYIVTALFGEPMTMKDVAMLAQFSTSTIKKAFVLATERKAEIIASAKFPRDSRLNLALWPSIDGKRVAQSSPTTPNAPMVHTPPALILSLSPNSVNVPQLAPLAPTSPIPKSSPEEVNFTKTTFSNIPVTSVGAMPPPPRRFKYATGTTRPTFSPIVSNSNGSVNAYSHKRGASDMEAATEATKPHVKRGNPSHTHSPTLPHHTIINSGVVEISHIGKRSASGLYDASEDNKSPAKCGKITHTPSLPDHGQIILKRNFNPKTAPAIVKPAVMKQVAPRKLVLPKVNSPNLVVQHVYQPISQLTPQATYQAVAQPISQYVFQSVSQSVYQDFAQNASHFAGPNIGSSIDINTYTAAHNGQCLHDVETKNRLTRP